MIPFKSHLDGLTKESGQTRPDPCTYQRGQLMCVPAQRHPESRAYVPLCWEEVGISGSSHRPDDCDTRPWLGWVRAQGLVALKMPRALTLELVGMAPEARGCRFWFARVECHPIVIHLRRPWPSASKARIYQAGSVYRPTRPTEGFPSSALGGNLDICLCLPLDRIWYKVKDPKVKL